MKENADKPNIKQEARELRKKVKRVEDSRSSIKAKNREKGKIIKAQQDRQKELEQNRDDWKAKCKDQERERIDADDKYKKVAALLEMKEEELRKIMEEFEELKKNTPQPRIDGKKYDLESSGHQLRSWFTLTIILLCIRLFIKAASPLRTTSKSLEIVFTTLPGLNNLLAPSCTTVKYWTAQVGYHKLKRVKTLAQDWVVMIDSSIQMGEKKCVLILGARSASLNKFKNRALTLEDLEVLSIRIVSTLNSQVITEMLTEVALAVGKIIAICSDRGSEILCGIKHWGRGQACNGVGVRPAILQFVEL